MDKEERKTKAKILLDGGDPEETRRIKSLAGDVALLAKIVNNLPAVLAQCADTNYSRTNEIERKIVVTRFVEHFAP
jgi:hypothetical protein